MRILLDTNVALDYLLKRGEFFAAINQVWQASLDGHLQCSITASSLTDIFYISRRQVGIEAARIAIKVCLTDLQFLTVDRTRLIEANGYLGSDFEDNLQIACAVANGIDFILTRDVKGFLLSPVEALESADFVNKIMGSGE